MCTNLQNSKDLFFNYEGGETLAHVVQRGGGCPILENIQCQVEWSSKQPGLAEDIPAHCKQLDCMAFKAPFQPKLFCSSVITCGQLIILISWC